MGRLRVGQHVAPAVAQQADDAAERGPADDVEDDVERAGTCRVPGVAREVPLGVVDGLVGAQPAEHLQFAGAVDGDDLGAGLLGQLHRVGAEAAAGADDEHPLPGADAGLAKEAERLGGAVGARRRPRRSPGPRASGATTLPARRPPTQTYSA